MTRLAYFTNTEAILTLIKGAALNITILER
jgi:hypothetical protein